MVPDEHGESTICNIYYDTADYRLIRASLEKPAYKEKLRLRSYGVTEPGGEVFLELKKKYKGIVYKRRITLPEDAAGEFIAGRAPLPERESEDPSHAAHRRERCGAAVYGCVPAQRDGHRQRRLHAGRRFDGADLTLPPPRLLAHAAPQTP